MGEKKNLRAMALEVCDKNFAFFSEHFDELYRKYKDKYIAIKDGKVIGWYITFDDAVTETLKTEEKGSFSVQHCSREEVDGISFYNNNFQFGVV
ncbi:MAG: DUF5678 domain-containing protein [Clostridiales bacterium]|jgi:hypothetical protein|nr:DUF5678 domain-containing protein [Clostridiales bacterium]